MEKPIVRIPIVLIKFSEIKLNFSMPRAIDSMEEAFALQRENRFE